MVFPPYYPPHAAFIRLGVPFSSYVPIMSTGCGYTHGFAPKFFLIAIPLSIFFRRTAEIFIYDVSYKTTD